MNKNTFVCPGMVVKLPYQLAAETVFVHCVIVEVFRYTVGIKNLNTGNIFACDIALLRSLGELIGYNYKEKWND